MTQAVASFSVRQTELDNGIRIITESVPHARTVSMGVLVQAGPRDEPPHLGGLAHLCEHLAFQGTSGRSANDIARLMDAVGGGMGAFTSHDYTCFTATVPSPCTPFALDLLGDILLNSTFSEDRLRTEQSAIICEIESRADHPQDRSRAVMRDIAFPGHSLGRAVTGTPESVRRLTRDDVVGFVQRHYDPSRIIFAAAGCLDHEDMVTGVRDGFWRMHRRHGVETYAAPRPAGGLRIATAPVSLAYFSLGLQAPPYADAGRYAMHVLARLLGGGISSKLYRRVREQRGLAYDISAEYVAYADAGLLVVEGSAPTDVLATILDLVGDELGAVAGGQGFDEDDLQRAQAQIRGQVAMSGDDMHARMSRLALQSLYFGDPISEADVVQGVQQVDAHDLAAMAGRCHSGGRNQALAIVGPAHLSDFVGGGYQAAVVPWDAPLKV
jgi:predicted Zn-dependent peptidase